LVKLVFDPPCIIDQIK